MLDTVRAALGRLARPDTFDECRNCGTAVPPDEDACPACGSTDVATYEL